jgi:di/tricarboxylate transporter
MDAAIALGVVGVAIALFATERVPLEVTSIVLVVLLVLTRLLTPEEALAGFSSDTVIFIFALLAMTQGMAATGVMEQVGRWVLRFGRFGPRVLIAALLAVVCAFSSVASNTAVTAAFLPIATTVASRAGIAKGQVLMPLAFSSMLGGTIFLFGTSTNLVVSAEMQSLGLGRICFAELAPVGLLLAVLGIAVTLFAARRLLPGEPPPAETLSLDRRTYLTEAQLTQGSRFAGKALAEVAQALSAPIIGLIRDGRFLSAPPQTLLLEHEHLVVAGTREEVLRVQALRGVDLRAHLRHPPSERDGPERLPSAPPRPERPAEDERPVLAEVAVPPTSFLAGRTLNELRIADRHGLTVLALHRHPALERARGAELLERISAGDRLSRLRLAVGDVLLVRGTPGALRALSADASLSVLGRVEFERPRSRRALLALAIFAVAMVAAALRLTAPSIAGLTGLVAMIATGCVDARTAFRVDWKVVILIGSLLALGLAMERSGAGALLSGLIVPLAQLTGPRGVLCVLMAATILLSVPMSNQAGALIMLPIALHTAAQLGVAPRPFAIGICLAASCAFATPLEPSAALVYGPGGYRFGDFLRVGTPVTLLMLVVLTFAVPVVWPFVSLG